MTVRAAVSRSQHIDRTTRVVMLVVLALMLVFILLPFFWMVESSLQSAAEVNAIPPVWIPKAPH